MHNKYNKVTPTLSLTITPAFSSLQQQTPIKKKKQSQLSNAYIMSVLGNIPLPQRVIEPKEAERDLPVTNR